MSIIYVGTRLVAQEQHFNMTSVRLNEASKCLILRHQKEPSALLFENIFQPSLRNITFAKVHNIGRKVEIFLLNQRR